MNPELWNLSYKTEDGDGLGVWNTLALEEGISWSVEKETHKSWSRAVGNKIASFFYLGHLVSLLAGEFSKEDYGIN